MAAISAFLGREEERARLGALVGERRLVTVVGPGGIGKTRLVEELCAGELAAGAGSVLRCQLASVAPRGEIGAEVAGQLGFPSLDSLALGLGDEPTLLVLDNCEHVRAAAATLCRALLEASPALRVLATSREPLGVDGEALLVLGPLPLPETGERTDVDAAPATRLFEERARSAGARAPASAADFAAIAELCRRLDGVPLAIELAAARARSLTGAELLAHLDRRFDLLQRAEPVGRARHRSLRAAIDTSYGLLDAGEQTFFRALGVFAGPFDADLAHAVAAPASGDRLGTLDLLSRLVDRSLVVAEPRGGVTRYRLLDSLRHYAGEQAAEAGETEALGDRFVGAMLAEADRIVAAGSQRWGAEVMEQILAQLQNLLAAVDRCVASDREASRAFRLLLPLWGAIHQGRAGEVAEACERALARWPVGDEPLRAAALAVAAGASVPAGRLERAEALAEAALRAPEPHPLAAVIAHRALAAAVRQRGDDAAAASHFRRGAALAAGVGLDPFERELVVCAAVIESGGERRAAALAELETARADAEEAGDPIGVVWALVAATHVRLRAGDLAGARRALEAAERARHGFAYPYGAMATARLRAALETLEGSFAAAAPAWRAAIDAAAGAGELAELALTLRAAAALARRGGDAASADVLLGAVPPGCHASVNGDLFDDPAAATVPPAAPGGAALRQARERLAALCGAAGDATRGAPHEPAAAAANGASDEAAAARGAPGGSARPTAPAPGPQAALLRAGELWTIRFAGREAQVRHRKGLEDLAALLARPGEELHCVQLAGASGAEGDAGPLLDERARREYQARVRELRSEIDDARAANDPLHAERAEAELDALVQQLSEAFGLGGRARRAGSTVERARSTVAWRLRAAVKAIVEAHPELGRHLENAVRTGTWCCYRPETDVAWDVQGPGAPPIPPQMGAD